MIVADAVSIGSAAMIAIGDNDPKWEKDYNKLGTTAGAYEMGWVFQPKIQN